MKALMPIASAGRDAPSAGKFRQGEPQTRWSIIRSRNWCIRNAAPRRAPLAESYEEIRRLNGVTAGRNIDTFIAEVVTYA